MQNEIFTDEDIYGVLDEHAAIRSSLENKIEELKQEIEDYEQMKKELIKKINHDIDVNRRCLTENISANTIEILNLWVKYDKELLEIINED